MINIGPIEEKLNNLIQEKGAIFILLLDPDSESPEKLVQSATLAGENGVDVIFMGGSFIGNPKFTQIVLDIKAATRLPVILFPGGAAQVTAGPDAILFTSLISGRNPQFLIDEQVRGGVLAKAYKLEPLPTAYVLIESGTTTAVEYISQTKPIPADKPQITAAHALAAEMMGSRWIYLEAGSGALNPVPALMVGMVKQACSLNIICGGGIRTPELAKERVLAGAHAIVVGNLFEVKKEKGLYQDFADAIHRD